jgi:hypothetical protein
MTSLPSEAPLADLLTGEPRVVAAGAAVLAEALQAQAAVVEQVDWRPPPSGSERALARVLADPRRESANATAVERLLSAEALLVDVRPAAEALGLERGTFLHAGPPIAWERASGPLRGALIGAVLLEGLADTPEQAERALAAGDGITLDPCHAHRAVGPMAGVVSPSMWMVELADPVHGGRAWCSLNEGLGKVLRYGAYGPEVLDRLRWMAAVLGPLLGQAVRRHGPVDVKAIVAQMLQMGDEGHNRNRAGTLMLLREVLPELIGLDAASTDVAEVARFVGGNDHFFLNLVMPACKLATDAARDVPGSSLVVTMARNGTDFGVQTSGTGDAWSTGPRSWPTGCSSAASAPTTPTPTSATRRSPRPPASGASPWPPPRRSSGSSAARSPTRWRPPSGCTRSRWRRAGPTRSRSWSSGARRRASTSCRSCAPASCRRSTPAWPAGSPAPARSAPAWSPRPPSASRPPWRPSPRPRRRCEPRRTGS